MSDPRQVQKSELEVQLVASKPDIVALKWVVGLMNRQAESAEAALVEYSNNPAEKKPLLQCMWAVHQITSTLRALGMKKGEMLTLEMERSLNYIYKEKVAGERRKLTMGEPKTMMPARAATQKIGLAATCRS